MVVFGPQPSQPFARLCTLDFKLALCLRRVTAESTGPINSALQEAWAEDEVTWKKQVRTLTQHLSGSAGTHAQWVGTNA